MYRRSHFTKLCVQKKLFTPITAIMLSTLLASVLWRPAASFSVPLVTSCLSRRYMLTTVSNAALYMAVQNRGLEVRREGATPTGEREAKLLSVEFESRASYVVGNGRLAWGENRTKKANLTDSFASSTHFL